MTSLYITGADSGFEIRGGGGGGGYNFHGCGGVFLATEYVTIFEKENNFDHCFTFSHSQFHHFEQEANKSR